MVEHSTADREVPGAPSFSFFFLMKERSFFLLSESMYVIQWSPQWVSSRQGADVRGVGPEGGAGAD